MSSKAKGKHVRDKWRGKAWYMVVAPPFFGNVELGTVPAEEPEQLIGRVVEATLYDITIFKGHEYSRDYLRSLVRRRTTKVDGIFNITTKDGYKMRVAVSALTLSRIRTSQEKIIRSMMDKTVKEKAAALTLDQFVQEMVLGKIASDVYNEAKKVAPLRHVGIRKSKLVAQPVQVPVQEAKQAQ